MAPVLKIAVHGVPDAEGAVRLLRQEARELGARFPATTGVRFHLSRDEAYGYEARLELLFPQHQIIVNGTGAAGEQAAKAAIAAAERQLRELARRDPAVAAHEAHADATQVAA